MGIRVVSQVFPYPKGPESADNDPLRLVILLQGHIRLYLSTQYSTDLSPLNRITLPLKNTSFNRQKL